MNSPVAQANPHTAAPPEIMKQNDYNYATFMVMMLIAVSQIVVTEFATITAAKNYWCK
jgi:hypothetical protein